MVIRRIVALSVLVVGILMVSCAAPAAPPSAPATAVPAAATSAPVASPTQAAAQTSAPTQTTLPTAAPTKAAAPSPAPAQTTAPTTIPTKAAAQPTLTTKLDMNAIFPPGTGREAVLDNCTTCHTFVPLVILQYSQTQWDNSARNHRDRVPRMSDGDFKAAYDYLAKNFNPDRPVPQLPKQLLDTWTDY